MKLICSGVLLALVLLAGCATPRGPYADIEEHLANREWMKAVIEARKQRREHPDDIALKSRLIQLEQRAADYYYHLGNNMLNRGNLNGALGQFQQGLIAKPEHAKLVQAIHIALNHQKANYFYQEAVANWQLGRIEDAQLYLEKVFTENSEHPSAIALHRQIKEYEDIESTSLLSAYSKERISVEFDNTDFKGAFGFIAESFGLNLVYDSELEIRPVTLTAEDISVLEALDLMVAATHTFYTKTGKNTILIADDTEQKRREYEEYYIRTFNLKVADAEETAAMLTGVLQLQNITVNKTMNSIVVRDKSSVLELAGQIIEANDRKPAELVLEVEILEVNREKTEQLGFDFGSEINVNYPSFSASGSWAEGLKLGRVLLPSMAFRYFKKDLDAKILANPKLRVMDNKKATLHVGDRIPFASTTTVEVTGQSRTSFDYRDIGIKMAVQPRVHLDNSVTVKLGLEVSSLGHNLGTASQPAWSVSTRNSTTEMLLRDGETAILAGLIKDEDRKARIKVPGFGDIPAVGALFTNKDDGSIRTDVLLTITPKIVRNWDLPNSNVASLYSGSKNSVTSQAKYAKRKVPTSLPSALILSKGTDQPSGFSGAVSGLSRPRIFPNTKTITAGIPAVKDKIEDDGDDKNNRLNDIGFEKVNVLKDETRSSLDGLILPVLTDDLGLRFSMENYNLEHKEEVIVEVLARGLDAIDRLELDVLLDPAVLTFLSADKGNIDSAEFSVNTTNDRSVVTLAYDGIEANGNNALSQEAVVAKLKFKASDVGKSLLLLSAQAAQIDGKPVNPVNMKASKVIVKGNN